MSKKPEETPERKTFPLSAVQLNYLATFVAAREKANKELEGALHGIAYGMGAITDGMWSVSTAPGEDGKSLDLVVTRIKE